ncbi:hypothetical protein [Halobacteriovorax sp. JY17]|uniref:hypothetical protein n=1 Tax=Halobacteriovorax sp. JY17 TaxID=2014617 RepID=UPI000C4AEAFC|nr:hypothetical protein [Halobacteriovorax sp. JY17]PIK14039.1 MAG: hypothetical protein CES88_13730 [Halobacteriovorax sp. JY17]
MKKITSSLLLLTSLTSYSQSSSKISACDLWQDLPNQEYQQIEQLQKTMFERIANTRAFYKISDQLLTEVSNNTYQYNKDSLDKWAAYSQLDSTKQTNIIKEWRNQFFKAFILKSYPKLTLAQRTIIDESFIELHKKAFPEIKKKSFEEILETAKHLIIKYIDSMKISKSSAMILKGSIVTIKLSWVETIANSLFMNDPERYLRMDIEYNPEHNVLIVGQKASKHIDGDTLLSIFIQQMALSFSPCRWSILFEKEKFPFQKPLDCLRNINSIYAKKRDDSQIQKLFKEKKITKEQKDALDKYPLCNTPYYPTEGLQKEQINIAFSDWFSAEVVSQMGKISPHFREDLCALQTDSLIHSYPQNLERLVRIYLANPKLRNLTRIKISKNINYCSM